MTTALDFCNWLQGVLDAHSFTAPDEGLNKRQIDAIQKKLSEAFVHEIDPSFPPALQTALHEAHKPPQPKVSLGFPSDKPVFIDGVKMGKDGVTPDSGNYFDPNSWEHVPGARC